MGDIFLRVCISAHPVMRFYQPRQTAESCYFFVFSLLQLEHYSQVTQLSRTFNWTVKQKDKLMSNASLCSLCFFLSTHVHAHLIGSQCQPSLFQSECKGDHKIHIPSLIVAFKIKVFLNGYLSAIIGVLKTGQSSVLSHKLLVNGV